MIESSAYENRRLRLLAELAIGRTVLDVGYAQQPNPYLGAFHRVGIDLQPPSQSSRVRYEEELVGDVSADVPAIRERTFDTIICGELIEHLENPYALLRTLRPLLAEGGRLLLSTPNPLAFPVFLAELFRIKRFFYTPDHLYYFLPRWVERLLDRTGYVLSDAQAVGLWTPYFVIPFGPVAMSYQVIYIARTK